MSSPDEHRGRAKKPRPDPMPTFQPTRRDRLRPGEIIVFAAILALFTALIVLLSTREFLLAGIALGGVFLIALGVLALLLLSFKENRREPDPGDLDDLDGFDSVDDLKRLDGDDRRDD